MNAQRDNSPRSEILASIGRNLAASVPFDEIHNVHTGVLAPGIDHNDQTPQASDLTALFCDKLRAVGGQPVVVSKIDEAAYALQKIIDELSPRSVALSNSSLVSLTSSILETEAEFYETATAAKLFNCDVGITSAQWAIAETGTLVLESKKEFNRLTSLIPETHICLIEATRIRRTMSEILQYMSADLSPAVTFITGPSRTSDIELTLAIGVHGPRRLYVLIVDSGRP